MAPLTYEAWIEHLRRRPIPLHVAIVPDGNGRWALKRGLPRPLGHRAGVESLKAIVKAAADLGVKCLTIYSFSTENWKRSEDEVSALMRLLLEYLESGIKENRDYGVRVKIIGRTEALKQDIRRAIVRAEEQTALCSKMLLMVAFNYGGRAEIVDVVRSIARSVSNGTISPEDISDNSIEEMLYTRGTCDPDVVIRTSGEMRMSNFLLWQAAYAEFVSSPVLWPDFTPEEFFSCIQQYQDRNRRFGGVTPTR